VGDRSRRQRSPSGSGTLDAALEWPRAPEKVIPRLLYVLWPVYPTSRQKVIPMLQRVPI